MIRLDKYISKVTPYSRSEVHKLIKNKQVKVNENIINDLNLKINESDLVKINDELITYEEYRYYILNKPQGYISSTIDEDYPSLLNLIDDVNLKIAGRLDQDTTGLIIVTNDGSLIHELTSPNKKLAKTYLVDYEGIFENKYIDIFKQGFSYEGEDYKPAIVENINNNQLLITIYEGKYHQIKQMVKYMNLTLTKLNRIKIGSLDLNTLKLEVGRYLKVTKEELIKLLNQ